MKKIILIYSLLIGFGFSVSAGVPGYMGRKFSIQYQFGLSPQWNDFNSPMPYMFHTAQIGYVVSRRHEIGIQYSRIDYNNSAKTGEYIYFSGGGTSYDGNVDARKFSGNNMMAYVKFFKPRKGFIAPLGSFIQFGLGFQYYTDNLHFNSGQSIDNIYVPHNYTVTSEDIMLGVGFGRNFIVANRLIMNLELDINWPMSAIVRIFPPSTLTGGSDQYGEFKALNAKDVTLSNIIHIKLGIGALLF